MEILAQRLRPHGDGDDLAERPAVSVHTVGGEPFQVEAENVEPVEVEGGEGGVEGKNGDFCNGLAPGEGGGGGGGEGGVAAGYGSRCRLEVVTEGWGFGPGREFA